MTINNWNSWNADNIMNDNPGDYAILLVLSSKIDLILVFEHKVTLLVAWG